MKLQTQQTESIANLYRVFAKYTIQGNLRGRSCPCCISDEEIRNVSTQPLRALTAYDLEFFVRKSISTFGDVDDLKYFLPRIFELMATNSSLLEDFLAFEKLNYAEWETWDAKESDAIEQYILLLFEAALQDDNISLFQLEQTLNLALKYVRTETVLQIWEGHLSTISVQFLVDFVWMGCDAIDISIVVKNNLLKWFQKEVVMEAILDFYFKTSEAYEQEVISMVYTMIENGIFIEKNNYAK